MIKQISAWIYEFSYHTNIYCMPVDDDNMNFPPLSFFSTPITPPDNIVYRLVALLFYFTIAAAQARNISENLYLFSPSFSLSLTRTCWTSSQHSTISQSHFSRLWWYGAYNMARKNYCIVLCTTRNFIFRFACGELKLFFSFKPQTSAFYYLHSIFCRPRTKFFPSWKFEFSDFIALVLEILKLQLGML